MGATIRLRAWAHVDRLRNPENPIRHRLPPRRPSETKRPVAIYGEGEGGRLALFAAALDERIDATLVSGSFGPRESLWKEPADRNVFGLLREFGDAELASLVIPRSLVVMDGTHPQYGYRAGTDLELDTVNRGKIPGKPGLLPHPTDRSGRHRVRQASGLSLHSPAPSSLPPRKVIFPKDRHAFFIRWTSLRPTRPRTLGSSKRPRLPQPLKTSSSTTASPSSKPPATGNATSPISRPTRSRTSRRRSSPTARNSAPR
jgi:hypothetical protein